MERSFEVWNEVVNEIRAAEEKFPSWPTDPLHAITVVAEELGETQKAILQRAYESGTDENVRKEAVQLAAMAFRFLLAFNSYRFERAYQTVVKM